MKNTELVIMAAGMGSRFGGLKQIEPFGPNGEALLDFSIYDAISAGFNKVIVIIKKEIEKDFRDTCGKRIEKMIDVEYAFQELDKLPKGYTKPEDRKSPWGTGHAILCAKDLIKAPFAVINSDDFYGREAYEILHKHLVESEETCMVGYKLGNTITENGTVTRGVCETENGYLTNIVETGGLDKNCGTPLDTTVSMNMWGFQLEFVDYLEKEFELFVKEQLNVPKSEFFIPKAVGKRIVEENFKVKVYETNSQWYGVTYKEDSEPVREAMKKLIDAGLYKF